MKRVLLLLVAVVLLMSCSPKSIFVEYNANCKNCSTNNDDISVQLFRDKITSNIPLMFYITNNSDKTVSLNSALSSLYEDDLLIMRPVTNGFPIQLTSVYNESNFNIQFADLTQNNSLYSSIYDNQLKIVRIRNTEQIYTSDPVILYPGQKVLLKVYNYIDNQKYSYFRLYYYSGSSVRVLANELLELLNTHKTRNYKYVLYYSKLNSSEINSKEIEIIFDNFKAKMR